MSERSPYLLRAGLVRNVRTSQHLTTFVVSAVATVLVTRLILRLAGYPEIGGKGLHIAHVLPGGLLMLAAILLLLGFVGPVIRPAAALVGGIGFGLFIDEVGKFVTADNDFFYRPAAAIMYVAFVLLVLAVQFLSNRRPFDPREHLANAVDHAVEGVAGGLSRRRLAAAAEQMRIAGPDVPGRTQVRALLAVVPRDDVELAAPVDALRDTVERWFDRLAAHPLAPSIAVGVLVFQAVGAPAIAVAIRLDRGSLLDNIPVIGVVIGSLLSAVFTVRGALRLRDGDRYRAVWLFELAVLSSLLVTQVFQFAGTQFFAVGGMLLDLTLLGLLEAEEDRLRRAAHARPAQPPAPAGSGSPSPSTV
jgi:hypothetical protein